MELNPKSEIKKTKKMKIVLAIDGSDFSEVAINELKKMTLSSNSEIHIINVYELPKTTGLGLHTMGGKIGNYIEEIKRSNLSSLLSDYRHAISNPTKGQRRSVGH